MNTNTNEQNTRKEKICQKCDFCLYDTFVSNPIKKKNLFFVAIAIDSQGEIISYCLSSRFLLCAMTTHSPSLQSIISKTSPPPAFIHLHVLGRRMQ